LVWSADRFDRKDPDSGHIAVVPALVIQAWNEYDLRIAREADIRQQVVQTTKQFGELREGARRLLLALAQLNTIKTRQPSGCSPLFSKLKARFANYGLLGAADTSGRIFAPVSRQRIRRLRTNPSSSVRWPSPGSRSEIIGLIRPMASG
jgi:hypothetical protein